MAEIIDFQGNTHSVFLPLKHMTYLLPRSIFILMVMQSLANITFETIFTLKVWVYLC